MLASEILRRLLPSTGTAVNAIGDLTQRGQLIPITLSTPEIDFTLTAPQTVNFLNSTIAGKAFVAMVNANFVRSRLTAVAGTLTTRPQGTIGNNGTVDNFATPASDAVSAAQFTAGVGAVAAALGALALQVPLNLSTPMSVKITTAAAGAGLTCKGRIYIPGYLVDV